MSPPTAWQSVRQVLGRALRETGQALDRLGVQTVSFAVTQHDYYDDPVVYQDFLSRHRQRFPLLTSGRPQIDRNVAFVAPCATLIGSVVVAKDASIWYGAVLRADACENAAAHSQFSSSSFNSSTNNLLDQQQQSEQTSTTSLEQILVRAQEQPPLQVPWPLPESKRTSSTTVRDDDDDVHGGGIFIGPGTNLQDGVVVTARRGHTVIGTGVTVGHLAQLHSCRVDDFALIGMGSILQEGVVVEREAMVGAGAVVPPHTVVRSGELWVGRPAVKVRDLTAAQRQKLHYQSSEYVAVAATHAAVMQLGGNVDPSSRVAVIWTPSNSNDNAEQLPEGVYNNKTPLLSTTFGYSTTTAKALQTQKSTIDAQGDAAMEPQLQIKTDVASATSNR